VIFIVVITVRREGLLGQREVPLDRLFAGRRKRPPSVEPAVPADEPIPAPDQSP